VTRPDPAHLLSAALRAQAGGSPGAAPPTPTPPPPALPRKRLPVVGVLLFALLLGLLAGVLAGTLTLFYPVSA
jgi:hypothetical protein